MNADFYRFKMEGDPVIVTDQQLPRLGGGIPLQCLLQFTPHPAFLPPPELPFQRATSDLSNGSKPIISIEIPCTHAKLPQLLGLYGLINVIVCLLVFLKLGWLSVGCVFLSYFFMSIMFPTIFALGIHGLGVRAKQASAFIVMAIMGGAILPKLMGHAGDLYGMSHAFIVPLACFAFVAFYGFAWPGLSRSDSPGGVKVGH